VPRLVNFGTGAPLECKLLKDVKIVTLFSNPVWPSAMKFGTIRGVDE